ncbi:2Fe-2S iron-sulfur cluster-binding protein [uncultured Thiodictyon sp.]|uniref:2Fe-2S iron-sulfur cluster-binding protein n=1 Tax=uncultured Thiodictyon sp. TaxID=1846217 RepID=UPI0025DCE924|nr:2Fe-2S iron-sulfur cluster-binding protein [uncultured Thiodictyon sp.]
MNTATLAFFIGSAILAQVLTLALLGFYRQRGRYLALVSGAARAAAPLPRRATTAPVQAPAASGVAAAIPAVGEPGAPMMPPATAPVMVHFSRSGRQARWTPGSGSLLDLAEATGVPVAPGCRVGSCGCCETAVESGEVAYAKTPEVRIESGHCLLCIGTAQGDLTLAL